MSEKEEEKSLLTPLASLEDDDDVRFTVTRFFVFLLVAVEGYHSLMSNFCVSVRRMPILRPAKPAAGHLIAMTTIPRTLKTLNTTETLKMRRRHLAQFAPYRTFHTTLMTPSSTH